MPKGKCDKTPTDVSGWKDWLAEGSDWDEDKSHRAHTPAKAAMEVDAARNELFDAMFDFEMAEGAENFYLWKLAEERLDSRQAVQAEFELDCMCNACVEERANEIDEDEEA
jgi:hypothetical protein